MEKQNEEQKISKYNQALASLMRLDGLWQEFTRNMLKGKMEKSKFILDRVWGELSADASNQDKEKNKEFKSRFLGLDEHIQKINPKKIQEDDWNDKFKKIKNSHLYPMINEYETFLREIQNSQGKGSSYKDEDEESMD